MSTTWTLPFHGVSHSRTEGKKAYGTITERGSWVELTLWYPGCGFNPAKQPHDSVVDARLAYNEWIKGQL